MNPQDPKDSKLDELGLPKPIEPFISQPQEVEPPSKEQLSEVMAPAIEQTEKVMSQAETVQVQEKPKVEQVEAVPTQEVQPIVTSTTTPTQSVAQAKDELVAEIENVLAEDLEKEYLLLTPKLKEKFKKEGETLAIKIKKLLAKSKINLKKISHMIMKWLRIIPHVNKYFLIQESKIKADKIANLKNKGL